MNSIKRKEKKTEVVEESVMKEEPAAVFEFNHNMQSVTMVKEGLADNHGEFRAKSKPKPPFKYAHCLLQALPQSHSL